MSKPENIKAVEDKEQKLPKPELIDVVCRRVQIIFFLEKTRDGKFETSFKPLSVEVPEVNFEQEYDIKKLAADLCRQVKVDVEKGKT